MHVAARCRGPASDSRWCLGMRTQIRIVAGSLRGRKVSCTVTPQLRPTPQMVREALFSILGDAVPASWTLSLATCISADGSTVGGIGSHYGMTEAWVATIPGPAGSMVLAAFAGWMARPRRGPVG